MDWVTQAGRGDTDDKRTWRVINALPPRPTQRTAKSSDELERQARDFDLKAFEVDCDVDKEAQLGAYEEQWSSLQQQLQDVQGEIVKPTCQQVQAWAAQTFQEQIGLLVDQSGPGSTSGGPAEAVPGRGPAPGAGLQDKAIPMLLLSLCGTSETEHVCGQLVQELKAKGHPTAITDPKAVPRSGFYQGVLTQWMGAPASADDTTGLVAWWEDTCATHQEQQHKRQQQRQKVERRPGLRGAQTEAATPGPSGLGQQQQQETGVAAAAASAEALQPPVLIIRDAEQVDMLALATLLEALSQESAKLPVVLVLALTTSHGLFHALMPNSVCRLTCQVHLTLPSAEQQLSKVYRSVLLAHPLPAVVLGPHSSAWLQQQLLDTNPSTSTCERVLQLALMEHALGQPLSCLLPAITSGSHQKLQAALEQLSPSQLERCGIALAAAGQQADGGARTAGGIGRQEGAAGKHRGGKVSGAPAGGESEQLVDGVWSAMLSYSEWRTGLLLLDTLASFTGASRSDPTCQLSALYTAATCPGFHLPAIRGALSPLQQLLTCITGTAGLKPSRLGAAEGPQPAAAVGEGSAASSKFKPVSDFSGEECQQLLEMLLQLLSGDGGAGAQGEGHLRPLRDGAKGGALAPGKGVKGGGAAGTARTRGVPAGNGAPCSKPAVDPIHGAMSDSWHTSVVDLLDSSDEEEAVTSREQQQEGGDDSKLQGDGASLGKRCQAEGCAAAKLYTANALRLQEALADLLSRTRDGGALKGATAAARAPRSKHGAGEGTAGASTAIGKRARLAKQVGQEGQEGEGSPEAVASIEQWEMPAAAAAATEAYLQAAQQRQGKQQEQTSPDLSPLAAKLAKNMHLQTPAAKTPPAHRTGGEGGPGGADGSPQHVDGAALTLGGLASELRKGAKIADPQEEGKGLGAGDHGAKAQPPGRKTKRAPVDPWGLCQRGGQQGQTAPPGAAVAASAKRRPKKKGLTKQELAEEEGQLGGQGGSCAAAVAAAVVHAKGGVAIGGNQRTQRLMQMVAPKPAGSPAVAPKPAAAGRTRAVQKAPFGTSQTVNIQRQQQQQQDQVAMTSPRTSKHTVSSRIAAAVVEGALTSGTPDDGMLDPSPDNIDASPEDPAALAAADQQAAPPMEQHWQRWAEQREASLSWALSELLMQAVPVLMAEWVLAPPAGAAAFTWDDAQVLQRCLAPQTRQELADALGQPGEQLPGCSKEMDATWEDMCVGYKLLQTYPGDGVPIGEWFGLFCSTVGLAVGPGGEEAVEGGRGDKRQRARAHASKRARRYGDIDRGGESTTADREGSTRKGVADGAGASGIAGLEGKQGQGGAIDQQAILEAASRFCQTAAELQLLGVWRPVKRQRAAAAALTFK